MTMYVIKGIILGIIFWQFIILLVNVITNENETIVIRTACCILIPFIALFDLIWKYLKLWNSRKYNLYQFFGKIDGSNYYEGWLFNYYMTPKTALKFERLFYKDEKVTKDYSIRLLQEGKEFKSAPFRNEIITIKDLNKFSIKFFQK